MVIDWLRALLDFRARAGGVVLSGGSLSNMTALAATRAAVGPRTAYLSDQAHAFLQRAV
jgi:glutamate/tyrosine decarboxylase-like PLP-dependent enzyme